MQFDEFDKKARAAADHHHPAYDEKAWTKMEKLLNKHLPQKEDDKRRFLFFILLFLGLGGAGLFIFQPWERGKPIAATEQPVRQGPQVVSPLTSERGKEKTKTDNTDIAGKTVIIDNNKPVSGLFEVQQPVDLTRNNYRKKNKNNSTPVIPLPDSKEKKNKPAANAVNNSVQNRNIIDRPEGRKTTEQATIKKTIDHPGADIVSADKKQGEQAVANNNLLVVDAAKPVSSEPAKIADAKKESQLVTQNKKAKTRKAKGNSFFFTLSAGPDVSFVGKDKMGAMKLVVGGGLGYTFNNRFTLGAGFYSGRKIYTASPDAYNPPASFYTYYPYLEKVDADCKVYEIPLSFTYNFSRTTKQNWFASAGISSYIMKSEKYNYFYKYYPTGATYNKERTIENVNKHYFSALTLSGGYSRAVNPNVSFSVEPYIKLPLSGIGYGKVKLKSGGLLFTIGIKPFTVNSKDRK
jgi:hypothetical protein